MKMKTLPITAQNKWIEEQNEKNAQSPITSQIGWRTAANCTLEFVNLYD
jgi:hypothetical protein